MKVELTERQIAVLVQCMGFMVLGLDRGIVRNTDTSPISAPTHEELKALTDLLWPDGDTERFRDRAIPGNNNNDTTKH